MAQTSYLVYKRQPATRYDIDQSIHSLIAKLSYAVEEKRKEDPSFDEIASLVNQIADNILTADERVNPENEDE